MSSAQSAAGSSGLAGAAGAALWALLGGLACAAMVGLEPSLLEEGFIVHAAQRMVAGEHLFRDIASFTGPVPFELLAAAFRLLGEEIAVARGLLVVAQALACAALFDIARRAGAGALAHIAAAALASAPVLLFPLFALYFYSTLAVHGCVFAAWAALRASGSQHSMHSMGWALAAGVVVAGVALTKQTVGAVLAVGLLAALPAGAKPGARLRVASGFAAGGAGAALATVGFYAVVGDLHPFLHWMVDVPLSLGATFTSGYMNFWPPGSFSAELRPHQGLYLPHLYAYLRGEALSDVGAPLVLLTQALYALPFVALAATALRRLRGPVHPGVWIHGCALVALATGLFPRTDWGHLVFVLPASVAQLVLCAVPPAGLAAGARRGLAAAAVAGFAVASVAAGAALHAVAGPASFGPRVPQRPVSAVYQTPAVPRVLAYLRERAEPGDALFVPRAEPLLYFASGLRNPTPFGGVVPGLREEQEAIIVPALADTRFVVMSEIDQPAFMYYDDQLPGVVDALERYFHLPREFAQATDAWIVALERGPDRGATAVDLVREADRARAFVRPARDRREPAAAPVPRLASRQHRRPLAFEVGAWGGGLDFDVEVPERAVFQADVGLGTLVGLSRVYSHPRPGRIVVSLIGADGRPVVVANAPVGRGGRTWRPLEADLSAYAGQRVALRVEFVAAAPVSQPVAWLGSPRIAVRP